MTSESLNALVDVLVSPFQELEDSAAILYNAFDLDTAVGQQLDWIGLRVGEPRLGREDTHYRAYIKARIAANTSDGQAGQIYNVARMILGDGPSLLIETVPPASYQFSVEGGALAYPWDASVAPSLVAVSLADALLAATSGGISLAVHYQVTDDAHTFTFASGEVEEDDVNAGLANDDDELDAGGLFVGTEIRE